MIQSPFEGGSATIYSVCALELGNSDLEQSNEQSKRVKVELVQVDVLLDVDDLGQHHVPLDPIFQTVEIAGFSDSQRQIVKMDVRL